LGIVGVVGAAAFETMAVYTAMPTAVKDLNGLQAYAWAFTGVALAALVATIVGGDLSDRIGPKLPLLGGLGVFVVGIVVRAAAPVMPVFVAGRMLQGLGGGAAIVAVYVVVARTYPDELRPQVFSVMAGAWVVPALVGPAIAGAITDVWGWRAVFLIVIPIVGLAVWAVRPQVNQIDGPPPALVEGEDSFVDADRGGRTRMALVMAAGAIMVQDGARRSDALGAIEAIVGLVVLFWALRSLLPNGVLRFARGLPAGVAARGLLAGAFFGAEAFVPLMLDDQRGFSVTMAGVALTASALGWFTGSWWQGRPSLNADRDRLVVIGALLILAGLLGMAAAVVAPLPFLVALLAWTVGGLGMGITIPSVNVRVLSLSPKSEQGANSAALQAIDGVGVIICTSLAGAIYASATQPVGDQASTFITLFLAMTGFAIVAVVAARRLHAGADDASVASTPEAGTDVINDVASRTPPPVIG
jgi:MFS family permease